MSFRQQVPCSRRPKIGKHLPFASLFFQKVWTK
uniref:Uncharacterized protein n=1 Tax=Arundo donax TaxID=35708 RepID=A0A0A9F9V6_ARUDO